MPPPDEPYLLLPVFLVVDNVISGEYRIRTEFNDTEAVVLEPNRRQSYANISYLVKENINRLRVFFAPAKGATGHAGQIASKVRIGRGVLDGDRLVIKYLYAETDYPAGRKEAGVRELWFETPMGSD